MSAFFNFGRRALSLAVIIGVLSSFCSRAQWVAMREQIPVEELQALLDLYNQTGGPNWARHDGWGNPEAISWEDVVVGDLQFNNDGTVSRVGHVYALFLGDNALTGPLPASFGNLTHLNQAFLDYNQITELPETVGDLTNLIYLGLINNRLTGSIPSFLARLTNLTSLNLAGNQFTGTIPEGLANLRNLVGLDLSFNQLSGPIPAALGNLTALTSFSANKNALSGSIPETIGNLTSLRSLYLEGNQLSGSLPESLGNLVSLEKFYIDVNHLTGPLPQGLGQMTNLRELFLRYNEFSGAIPDALGNLTQLTHLDLGANQLSGPIPSSLGNLSQLQYLDLMTNQFSGTVPQSLGNLTKLETLILRRNDLEGGLPVTLSNLRALQYFSIADNFFSMAPGSANANVIQMMIGNGVPVVEYLPQRVPNHPINSELIAPLDSAGSIDETVIRLPITVLAPNAEDVGCTVDPWDFRLIADAHVEGFGTVRTLVIVPRWVDGIASTTIRVRASDGSNEQIRETNVRLDDKLPPVFPPIPNQVANEGSFFDIAINLSGPDPGRKPDLTFYEADLNFFAAYFLLGTWPNFDLSLSPRSPDTTGTTHVGFVLSDGTRSQAAEFFLTLIDQPEPPVISNFVRRIALAGQPLEIRLPVSDADTPLVNLTAAVSSVNSPFISDATAVVEGPELVVRLNVSPGATGSGDLNLSVSDGQGTASSTVQLFFDSPGDDPPMFGFLGDSGLIRPPLTISVPFNILDVDSPMEKLHVSASAATANVFRNVWVEGPMPVPFNESYEFGVKVWLDWIPNVYESDQITVTMTDGTTEVKKSFKMTISNESPTVIFDAIPDVQFGVAPIKLHAVSNRGRSVLFIVLSGPAVVNDDILTVTGIGQVLVRAYEPFTDGGALRIFQVTKTDQTITFDNIPSIEFGSAMQLHASASSGLPVTFEVLSGPAYVNGSIAFANAPGEVRIRASQGGNENYNPASVERIWTVKDFPHTAQQIIFPPLPSVAYGTAPLPLDAIATSGLPVSFDLIAGPGRIENGKVVILGVGTITIRAMQLGDSTYQLAAPIEQSFVVTKAQQTIFFPPIPAVTYIPATVQLVANASSGLPVTFVLVSGSANILGNQLTANDQGAVVVRAIQQGSQLYEPAPAVDQTWFAGKSSQTITFSELPPFRAGGSPVKIVAMASSGLPITLTLLAGPGQLDSDTLTLGAAGTLVIRASQAGNSIYLPASVDREFTVFPKISQSIQFDALPNFPVGTGSITLQATASSGLPVTFTVVSGSATVSGPILTIQGPGHITIRARRKPGTSNMMSPLRSNGPSKSLGCRRRLPLRIRRHFVPVILLAN